MSLEEITPDSAAKMMLASKLNTMSREDLAKVFSYVWPETVKFIIEDYEDTTDMDFKSETHGY